MPIVFIFLASALIVPIGASYSTYGNSSAFTTSGATTSNQTITPSTPVNQTKTNMTMPVSSTPPVSTSNANKTSHPLSPLKQFKSGISAKNVQCQPAYSLVIKAEDSSPACVHSSTVQILIQRGWAAIH